jgi:hypothetical protein
LCVLGALFLGDERELCGEGGGDAAEFFGLLGDGVREELLAVSGFLGEYEVHEERGDGESYFADAAEEVLVVVL